MELEICTKTVQNFSGKLRGKLSTLCLSRSVPLLRFLGNFLPERSLVEGEKLQRKETRKGKDKAKK